jgi:chemotaxis response regulator CheB
VVYGMPKAAALLGAAGRILALSDIGPEIGHFVARQTAPRRATVSKRPARR